MSKLVARRQKKCNCGGKVIGREEPEESKAGGVTVKGEKVIVDKEIGGKWVGRRKTKELDWQERTRS